MNPIESEVEHALSSPGPAPNSDPWRMVQEVRTRYREAARARSRRTRSAIGLLFIPALAASYLIAANVASRERPDCTIGYKDSSANLEFRGVRAGALCDGYAWQDSRFYLISKPSGEVICRVQAGAVTGIVRAAGSNFWTGIEICAGLLQRQTAGKGL